MNLQKIIEAKNTIFGKIKKNVKFLIFLKKKCEFHQNLLIFTLFFIFFTFFNFTKIVYLISKNHKIEKSR